MTTEDAGARGPATQGAPTQGTLGRSQVLWAEMLASKREQLAAAKAQDVLDIHSFTAMQTSLQGLHAKDGSRLGSKILQKLDPIVDRVQNLTAAISIFIQSDPTYSALTNKTVNKKIGMLQSLTTAMPRFEQYMALYPKSGGLETALLRILETRSTRRTEMMAEEYLDIELPRDKDLENNCGGVCMYVRKDLGDSSAVLDHGDRTKVMTEVVTELLRACLGDVVAENASIKVYFP
ncbi:hypothetical protein B0T16DRAFT_493830 [Cercophora newfieldiana]|uniref:Uncharacterized protein n=1 Tax=Cercophora newfieldiana TaxID=92897 RepID=A0AA39Y8N8_9PEZI|nr:hypothetical protein B0T16DRAFT_493830 [Cercophora newfieldiana]